MPLLDDLRAPVTPEELERRRFLALLGAGALGAAAVGTIITTVRYLEPAVLFEEDVRFPVGRPQDVAPGTVLVFLKEKVYVVHGARGFYALSAVCTHLGCVTRWGQEPGHFSCPCHGSRFALDGRVAAGPAPRPLRRVLLTLEAGQLVVDARRVVADDSPPVVA